MLLVTTLSAPAIGVAQGPDTPGGASYGDPTQFEEDIRAFEASDQEHPPPAGAIVCMGSSSIRRWHETIHDDLAPLTVIARGFGGSNMNDALHYAERMVLAYAPRAVVLYEGDNDVEQGISPGRIAGTFGSLVERIHETLPATRIYFLSIKPSIDRWAMWPEMRSTNRLIAAACEKDNRLTYVDVASGMLTPAGEPKKEIFVDDDLHLNRDGYLIWRDILKPVLIDAELSKEAAE